MPNQLAKSHSLYLRQHSHHLVEWQEWSAEIAELARRVKKPIFLSIGYSSCHWCHVMAEESFEDQEVAEVLNRDFLSIKVDREERPDIDDVFITACQIANGHAGWPLTVFATPDLEPFFVATYLTREQFLSVARGLAQAWKTDREQLITTSKQFAEAIQQVFSRPIAGSNLPLNDRLSMAFQSIMGSFDFDHGGFGGAPKFPHFSTLEFMIDLAVAQWEATSDAEDPLVQESLSAAYQATLAMCRGGIHDHIGGGFHRYSVDAEWSVPHFEKMTSDNAQALSLLSRLSSLELVSPHPLIESAKTGVHRWLVEEMRLPDGTFATAMDAVAEGVEGQPYVWSPAELSEILGGIPGEIDLRPMDPAKPNGANVVRVFDAPIQPDHAKRLKQIRDSKPQPARDDKAVAAINGMVILALHHAGDRESASRCADAWLKLPPEDFPHQLVDGSPIGEAFLDDLVWMAYALLSLGGEEYVGYAKQLIQKVDREFLNPQSVPYFSSGKHGTPVGQNVPVLENATPSPLAVLIDVYTLLGEDEKANHLAAKLSGWTQAAPISTSHLLRQFLKHRIEVELVAVEGPQVKATLKPEVLRPDSDGVAHGVVELVIPEGHHIHSYDPPALWMIPTTIRILGALGEAGFPQGHEQYEGVVQIPVRLYPQAPTAQIAIGYQLCSASECFESVEELLEVRFDFGNG